MITKTDKKITLDKVIAEKYKVYDFEKYDETKKELAYTINKKTGKGFVLVHDKVTAFSIIEGTEETETVSIHIMEEFDTEQECLDRIKELGLKYTPPEVEIEPIPKPIPILEPIIKESKVNNEIHTKKH